MYQLPYNPSNWKAYYKFALDTAKLARTKGVYHNNRAKMAELLASAHWWLEHRD